MKIQGDAELGHPIKRGKLGCIHPPATRDRIHLMSRVALAKGLPCAPSYHDFSREILADGKSGTPFAYGSYKNNVLGCCTCATYGGCDCTVAKQLKLPLTVTDGDVIRGYDAISDWDASKPGENDNGASADAAADYWAHALGDGSANGGLIRHHREIDASKRSEVELAVHLYMGMVITLDLPKSIWSRHQKVWDTIPSGVIDPDYAKGSLGGHSVWMAGYDARGPIYITWGQRQAATWEFHFSYLKQGIVAIHRLLAEHQGLLPNELHGARAS